MRTLKFVKYIDSQLDVFEKDVSELNDMLFLHSRSKCSDDIVFKKFLALIKRYPANSLIMARLLEYLQLVNDDKILKLYSLKEVELMYSKIADSFKDDIDINMEYIHFVNSVCDNEKQALKIYSKLKKRVSKKMKI